MDSLELIVAVFDSESQAAQILENLKTREQGGEFCLFDAAIIAKDAQGRVGLKETRDVDAKRGTLFGALLGGLIGFLAGPVGAAVGTVVGAATAGLVAARLDLGFSNDFLNSLKAAVKPNSSLILVLVEKKFAESVALALSKHAGQLFRNVLRDEVVRKITAD